MSVFKREEVLYPEYLPLNLPHREGQIRLISENLSLLLKNSKPMNIFIYGPPGVGKTAVAKFILREFEQYSGIKNIYINCWQYNTSFAILSEIGISIGAFVSRRGWAKDEIFSRIVQTMENNRLNLIVVLDEVDQLVKNDSSVLYDLLRIENYTKQKIGLIFISNDKYVFRNVEERIRSSLNLEEIEFKPYTFLEMKDIVEERMKEAFVAYEDGVSALIAARAAEKGDVRIALEILLKAGRIAKDKLRVEDVKKVIKEEINPKAQEIMKVLSEEEKRIIEILDRPKTTKEIFEELKKSSNISRAEFYRILNEMIKKGLIKILGKKNRLSVLHKVL
ncbi:MAG: AAA family ATPase [Candidatus Aenigmarchaeota archaeon]|nr:AAA family ATPase [Candidatus Aenigmarchaeota archaeon]